MRFGKAVKYRLREQRVEELRLCLFEALTMAACIEHSLHSENSPEPDIQGAAQLLHRMVDEVTAEVKVETSSDSPEVLP